ncbi:MAG: hypothetical protein MUC59_02205 [Saprospiraceae bacterium]|nr:hypothetical protein [Saprospiraceae bacterium]
MGQSCAQTLPAASLFNERGELAIQKVDALEGNQVVVGKLKLPIGASYREEVLKVLL